MSRYQKLLQRVEELEQSNKSLVEQVEKDAYKESVLYSYNSTYMSGTLFTRKVSVPSLKAKVDAILNHLELEIEVESTKASETIKAVSTKKAKK